MRAIRIEGKKSSILWYDRRCAVFFAFTCGTHTTSPYGIKVFLRLQYKSRFVGKYSCFKIALPLTLHPYTCARKIGTTDISRFAIEDHKLEMNTRT